METQNEHSSLDQSTAAETFTEISGWLVVLGLIMFALFPLALPFLLLTVAAVLPLLLIPVVAGLAMGVVAAPLILLWKLGAWTIRALRGSGSERRGGRTGHGAPARTSP